MTAVFGPIKLPPNYNYMGVFLTLRCNLTCDYCINRHGEFDQGVEMDTDDWIKGLSRIETSQGLPITLQGGEPTTHPGFYEIVDALYKQNKHLDLLTNGLFDVREFCQYIGPDVFKREAKYASLRFSFHEMTNATALAMKVWLMQNNGYEVGIWGLKHPNLQLENMVIKHICKWLNIDFRLKEFLGYDGGQLYGTYKYPDACTGHELPQVMCKPTELLINPSGHIFRCHADLYANRNFIGHILDKEIKWPDFEPCEYYGHCNPCDTKIKYNRFQEHGHSSVTIKGKGVKENEDKANL